MRTISNPARNNRILELVKRRRLSYSVIAEMEGVSRNVVAGVAFRARHPLDTRVPSPAYARTKRGKGNKTGTGWQPHSYEPVLTAANTR